jgi:predicted neutral ceramidase superfamily lipid hydrolase
MSLKEDPAEIRLNVAVSHWTSYLLIAAMIACSALTVGSFVQRMMADWQPWLMAAVCFVVALDGLFIHHRMKNEKIHGSSWLHGKLHHV